MGRWRGGGGRRRSKRSRGGANDRGAPAGGGFPPAERAEVEEYLSEYREKALAVHQQRSRHDGDDRPPRIADADTDGDGDGGGGGDGGENPIDITINTATTAEVAGHALPSLTAEACGRPYLVLPPSLSGSERRAIHELCVGIGMYHAGVGGPSGADDRSVAVSVYADGLDRCPTLERSAHEGFPSRRCRPFVLRPPPDLAAAARREAADRERDAIEEMARYPYLTLRRGRDDLNLAALDGGNLSDVTPPRDAPWTLVESASDLEACASDLRGGGAREVAFDLEMHNRGGGPTRTCLLQLSSDLGTDYVVDVLAPGVWDAVSDALGPIFADPAVVKIGHAIGGMDVQSLWRDFGILVRNAFDTQEAAVVVGKGRVGSGKKKGPPRGLADLCRYYGLPSWEHYSGLKRRYQNSDWRVRPLSEDALEYGRYDVRFLVRLRRLLMRDLILAERGVAVHSLGNGKSNGAAAASGEEEDAEEVELASSNGLQGRAQSSGASEGESSTPSFSRAASSFVSSESSYYRSQSDRLSSDEIDDDQFYKPPEQPAVVGEEEAAASLLDVDDLRMQSRLMEALSMSQRQCLKRSKNDGGSQDAAMANRLFLAAAKRAANDPGRAEQGGGGKRGGRRTWTDAHTALYRDLAAWRVAAAQREGTHPADVCSSDLLYHAASGLLDSKDALRTVSHFLPEILEDDSSGAVGELVAIVRSSDAYRPSRSFRGKSDDGSVQCYDGGNAVADRGVGAPSDDRQKAPLRWRGGVALLLVSAVLGACAVAATKRRGR